MTTRLKLPGIRKALALMPWAIQAEKLEAILEVITYHADGRGFSREEIQARVGDRQKPMASRAGGIQVLPLYGVIAHRMNLMSDMSGGTSTEQFADAFDAAMADPNISTIVLDVDSPGGSVQGTPELASRIFNARGKGKKLIAVANATMASAAYWIGSACDELVATPSAEVGSIGVFGVHLDTSAADEQAGLKYTLISAGKYKTEGNQHQPLSPAAEQAMQAQVDLFYGMFIQAVAQHRGIAAAAVKSGYGQGRALLASQALGAGIIDRIDTLDAVLSKLGARDVSMSGRPRMAARSAATLTGGLTISAGPSEPGDMPTDDPDEDIDDAEACPQCGAAMDGPTCKECGFTSSTDRPLPNEAPMGDGGDDDTSARAGGAATRGAAHAPEHSRPQQAKEHTVPNQEHTAARDGADPASVLAAERRRVAEIRSLGREHKLLDERVDAMVDSGMPMEQVTAEILKDIRTRATANPAIRVGETREAAKPFVSLGEQLQVIRRSALSGEIDQRLKYVAAATGMGEAIPSDGGFALQPDFSAEILRRSYQLGELLSRVRRTPIGPNANGLKINAIDETSRATGSRYGGIQMFWANEGDAGTPKKPKMRQMELALRKLIGLWYAGDELLQDSTALTAVAEEAFVEEVTFMVEDAIVNGTGSGQPLGILNSNAPVNQVKEGGQAATTFVTANAAKMFGRLWARSMGNAIWLINQDVWQQFLQLTIGASAWPVFIPPGGVSTAPYGTLYGRPVVPVEYCATLGTVGDVIFADLGQYLLIDKGGPTQAQSIHVRFVNDETAFRLTYRVDGQPIWNAPLTPKNGSNTVSPFITLQAR